MGSDVDLGDSNYPSLQAATGAQIGAAAPSSSPVRLVGLLGEGGMARVYLAHHEGLGRQVAVKRLRSHLAGLEEARERLRIEASIASQLRHDHIVDVIDLVTDPDGETYLVMEHVAGEPLSTRLSRAGALPLSEVLVVAQQVADALEAVHRRGILHRDLKTENVLVSLRPDGTILAKLIDFGVAEMLGGPDDVIISEKVVGTPESMAPEQAQSGSCDRRSDIYSFGVLMYEMVAGVPPFLADSLPALFSRVVHEAPLPPSQQPGGQKQLIPAALEQLILMCLAKRPSDRPQSMGEVRERLDAIAAEYHCLTEAVEHAMNAAIEERVVKQALVVVAEVLDQPTPARPAVRAVGTSERSRGAARPLLAARPALPAVPADGSSWLPRHETAELVREQTETRSETRSAAPVLRKRMGRIVRTSILVAALAAGGVGLFGTLTPSGNSDEMESSWHLLFSSGR
jgi:tRNA A-37 threonylcarbamoyl transferase component Bud32